MLQNRYKPLNGGGGPASSERRPSEPLVAPPAELLAPMQAPPRRSVSVNHLARQLQSHTRVSPQVMVTPSRQFNHNNNRPFSYLSPGSMATTGADAAPNGGGGGAASLSDEDEGLEIDAAYKPRQVSFSNKYRQVFFSENDFPTKSRYEDDDRLLRKSYDEELPKKRFDDDLPKIRFGDDYPSSKRYEEELQSNNKKKSYDDLRGPSKRYEEEHRRGSGSSKTELHLGSSRSGGHRYLSEQNSNSRDVVDSGIENDHPKQRTRTAERTSSRVSERAPSRVSSSTLRREHHQHQGRDSPAAMQSARLVQQAAKSSSPRRRSLSILDEDAHDAPTDNNRTKTIEKEKKKRKLRLKNFFMRDKSKNNDENKEQPKTSTLKRTLIREKSGHEPSDTDQASCDELRPLSSSHHHRSTSSGNNHHHHRSNNHLHHHSSQQQHHQSSTLQRRPVKRSSSMHATSAPPPAPTSRRAPSRSGSSVVDTPNNKLSWFKTVDRFTFRKKKEAPEPVVQAPPPRRTRRPFDDTDPESAPEPATLERRHFKPRANKTSSSSSGAGGASGAGVGGARRGVQQRQNRLLANSSEESENNEPKPMYLHDAAVGDIPGRLGPRRTVSREELAAQKPARHLSRSFSVLAPWRPSKYQGHPEIYYPSESSEKHRSKPPRGPHRMTASIESLGGSGSSLERGRTSKYKSRTNVNGL